MKFCRNVSAKCWMHRHFRPDTHQLAESKHCTGNLAVKSVSIFQQRNTARRGGTPDRETTQVGRDRYPDLEVRGHAPNAPCSTVGPNAAPGPQGASCPTATTATLPSRSNPNDSINPNSLPLCFSVLWSPISVLSSRAPAATKSPDGKLGMDFLQPVAGKSPPCFLNQFALSPSHSFCS